MLRVLRTRWRQHYRTIRYPDGPPPALPERFAGRPVVESAKCPPQCRQCVQVCPTQAIEIGGGTQRLGLDTGRCLFCRECQNVCPAEAISFSREFRIAASRREDLVVADTATLPNVTIEDSIYRILGRSLKLRQVSAGGCNACEADTNVLSTVGWDLGRFGIQFVASPRHADGLLITGPVTQNMRLALEKTYRAVPSPKVVIAAGTCAISGGIYEGLPDVEDGVGSILPVDLFIPGCPPHPLTLLHALLALTRQLPTRS